LSGSNIAIDDCCSRSVPGEFSPYLFCANRSNDEGFIEYESFISTECWDILTEIYVGLDGLILKKKI
jgi:hypothetical protein